MLILLHELNYLTYFYVLDGLIDITLIPLEELTRISLFEELFLRLISAFGVRSRFASYVLALITVIELFWLDSEILLIFSEQIVSKLVLYFRISV